jgi:hypothetical protein
MKDDGAFVSPSGVVVTKSWFFVPYWRYKGPVIELAGWPWLLIAPSYDGAAESCSSHLPFRRSYAY